MKNNNFKYVIIAFYIMFLFSCNERDTQFEQESTVKADGIITLGGSTKDVTKLAIFPYVDSRKVSLGVNYGGKGYPGEDIHVKIQFNQKAFDSINAIRVLNGQNIYYKFPDGSYTIDKQEFTIRKGELNSDYGYITYKPNSFDPKKDYLLTYSITDAQGYKINQTGKTTFFVVNQLSESPVSTSKWKATASSEELVGEGTKNGRATSAIDGDITTYWHSQWQGMKPPYPYTLTFDFTEKVFVTKLGLITRQNNLNGFTKFDILITKDGTKWETYKSDLVFNPANIGEQFYPLDQPMDVRGVQLILKEGKNTVSFLAEFKVYTFN